MYELKIRVEIKTYLTNSNDEQMKESESYCLATEELWKSILDALGFESQFHRYTQGVCDCDHVTHTEWTYLSISLTKNLNVKENCLHFFQIIQSYAQAHQNLGDVDYCKVSLL